MGDILYQASIWLLPSVPAQLIKAVLGIDFFSRTPEFALAGVQLALVVARFPSLKKHPRVPRHVQALAFWVVFNLTVNFIGLIVLVMSLGV